MKEAAMRSVIHLGDATWVDVQHTLGRGVRTALFAVGSTEQHGPHLPFCTDSLLGDALCARVASAIGGAIVAPTIHVGFSDVHMDFPGSLTAPPAVLAQLVHACCQSLVRHGIERIVVIPSHGGNFKWLENALGETRFQIDGGRVFAFTDWPKLKEAFDAIMVRDGLRTDAPGFHAGEVETSMMLHLRPDLVHMDRAEAGCQSLPYAGRPYGTSIKMASPIGVLGDPRPASSARGVEYLDVWANLISTAAKVDWR